MSKVATVRSADGQTPPTVDKKRRALLTQSAAVVVGVAAFDGPANAQPPAATGASNAVQLRATGAAAFGKTLKHDALGLLLKAAAPVARS